MVLFLIAFIIYALLALFSAYWLMYLTPSLLLILLYLIPVGLNLVFYKYQNSKYRRVSLLLFPSLSLLSYMLFTYVSNLIGIWDKFVRLHTVSNGNVSVEVAQNLLSVSQVVFVLVLFYGTLLAYYFILEKRKQKGAAHA